MLSLHSSQSSPESKRDREMACEHRSGYVLIRLTSRHH